MLKAIWVLNRLYVIPIGKTTPRIINTQILGASITPDCKKPQTGSEASIQRVIFDTTHPFSTYYEAINTAS